MGRKILTPKEVNHIMELRSDKYPSEKVNKLHSNLILPSYVHGYSLAMEYMKSWFESKFEPGYFKGGIYIDGKHVLDDYKNLNKKELIKRINPRARMGVSVEYDYDRETLDTYLAPPEMYIRRSRYNESFFKDYERDMFLGLEMKALRMNFAYKVRVNTRAQQVDLYNRMQLYFRNGSTMYEYLSVDFHIPKELMLHIADKAGFDVVNGEIVDIISFLNYVNSHSDLPFLFKIRAINQKAEFFIRVNGLYTHINCTDKLQLDDGERDGKLDFNFHVEMNCVLTIPIPKFYAFYSASEFMTNFEVKEPSDGTVAIYSINAFDIPNQDHNGWIRAAITEYATDKGDTEMDLSSIFSGDNILSQAINHDLTLGISPYKFINIVVYKGKDEAKLCHINMDWNTKIATFDDGPQEEDIYQIAIYYDRNYINELDIELNKYNENRVSVKK